MDLPSSRLSRLLTLAPATAALAFGVAVVAGWHSGSLLLSGGYGDQAPVRYVAGLGFVLTGLTMLGLGLGRAAPTRVLAMLLVALGLGSLLAAATETPAVLNRLLAGLPLANGRPVWMSSYAAVVFSLLGTGALLHTYWRRLRYPSLWVGLAGTLAAGLGLMPAFSQLSDLEQAAAWQVSAGVALPAAVGLVLQGVALLNEARRLAQVESGPPPSPWMAVCLAVGIAGLSLMIWQALRANEYQQMLQNLRQEARTVRTEITTRLAAEVESLQRMAERVGEEEVPPGGPWHVAARYLTEQQHLLALAWVGWDFRVLEVVPETDSAGFLGNDLSRVRPQRQAMFRALRRQAPAFSEPLTVNGRPVLFSYVPVYWEQIFGGFLLAAYPVRELAGHLLRRELSQGYGAALIGPDGQLFGDSPPSAGLGAGPVQEIPLDIYDLNWQLVVWPEPSLLAASQTRLPDVVLASGLAMALLLAYSVRSRQLLELNAARMREFNSLLEQRVSERTAALVASNEELAKEATRRAQVARELSFLAKYDPLTGLPNRTLFHEHLNLAVSRASREGRCLAVLFLDLDNFKDINDTLGHHAGDELLQQLSARLRELLRESDIIGRLGGDEFVVLTEDLPHVEDSLDVAEKILAGLKPPFQLGDSAVVVSTSIGIATYPESGSDASTLIKNADAAMYQAKAEGRDTFTLYSTRLHRRAMERLAMKHNLQRAVDRQEFLIFYQPKIHLASGRIVGAEALLRWRVDGRMISPKDFIPLTEETGLIIPIGGLVMRRVCQDLANWQKEGLALPEVSVNVSAKQFLHNRLLDDIYGCLEDDAGLAHHLELELTERVFIEDSEAHRWLLKEVESLGIRISIDDFGTGCSSFGYFRNFPIHAVKIDQSFVRHVTSDSHDAKITETVLDLAQNFNLTVVAEGVETRDQRDFLRERNCDQAQGYYFSRAVPEEQFRRAWERQDLGLLRTH